jgi:predicted nucleic acid-binding protein
VNFADTSVLCALYRDQGNSAAADTLVRRVKGPIHISALVLFEFRQATRLLIHRFSSDRTEGLSQRQAQAILDALQSNLSTGGIVIAPVPDWARIYSTADRLSALYTAAEGFRTVDLLHVATALEIRAANFLTFDLEQSKLAKSAGLTVKP